MKDFRNILIVRTDRIGDVVLMTPAIKALRVAYPSSKITVLVAHSNRELLEGNPFIDSVLTDDRKNKHRGVFGFFNLVQMLRKKHFDLAVNFHTKKRTNLALFLAGIPHRVGYKDNKYGFLLSDPIKDVRWNGDRHEAQLCMDVVQHLGAEPVVLEPLIPYDEMWEDWIQGLCDVNQIHKDTPLVAVHLGASDPSKRWPIDRFAELIGRMREHYGCKFVLIGAEDTLPLGNKLNQMLQPGVLDLSGKTTLGQLVSLFRYCQLLISNDSGPVHVADALGVPVVSIFTRNLPGINPGRWRPLGKNSRCVSVSPNLDKTFKKAGDASCEYLELIGVKEVFDSVDQIFKLC